MSHCVQVLPNQPMQGQCVDAMGILGLCKLQTGEAALLKEVIGLPSLVQLCNRTLSPIPTYLSPIFSYLSPVPTYQNPIPIPTYSLSLPSHILSLPTYP